MSDRESPSVMVDAIIERNDELLLVKRKEYRLKEFSAFQEVKWT